MDVDVQVEIGTPEQKEAIKAEILAILGLLGDDVINHIDLHQVIVPMDFDATVNRLQNTTWYKSDRIQLCVGKTSNLKAKITSYYHLSLTPLL